MCLLPCGVIPTPISTHHAAPEQFLFQPLQPSNTYSINLNRAEYYSVLTCHMRPHKMGDMPFIDFHKALNKSTTRLCSNTQSNFAVFISGMCCVFIHMHACDWIAEPEVAIWCIIAVIVWVLQQLQKGSMNSGYWTEQECVRVRDRELEKVNTEIAS